MTSDSDSTVAPYLTARISTMNRNGMDRNTSTTRIRVESMRPPANPATAPTSEPMVIATKAAKNPISSASWPPFISSPRMSKPLASVPSGCPAPGGSWELMRSTWTRFAW